MGKEPRFKDNLKSKSWVNPPGAQYNVINDWLGKNVKPENLKKKPILDCITKGTTSSIYY